MFFSRAVSLVTRFLLSDTLFPTRIPFLGRKAIDVPGPAIATPGISHSNSLGGDRPSYSLADHIIASYEPSLASLEYQVKREIITPRQCVQPLVL